MTTKSRMRVQITQLPVLAIFQEIVKMSPQKNAVSLGDLAGRDLSCAIPPPFLPSFLSTVANHEYRPRAHVGSSSAHCHTLLGLHFQLGQSPSKCTHFPVSQDSMGSLPPAFWLFCSRIFILSLFSETTECSLLE